MIYEEWARQSTEAEKVASLLIKRYKMVFNYVWPEVCKLIRRFLGLVKTYYRRVMRMTAC